MALYRPDPKLIEAEKIVENMEGFLGDSVRYYVAYLKRINDDRVKVISEMSEVFNGISKFTR